MFYDIIDIKVIYLFDYSRLAKTIAYYKCHCVYTIFKILIYFKHFNYLQIIIFKL